MKKIRSRLTMKFKESSFIDTVNGRMVNIYTDCFGVEWMAQSKFGFRVKTD